MEPKINVRLVEPSKVEIIRDQISAIIALEMQEQYRLAVEDGDPVADDYRISEFIENDEPWNVTSGPNKFPFVNISIDHVAEDSNSTINKTIRTVQFNIDCYQIGNYEGKYAGRNGCIKAWKLARCIDKILSSDEYTYLALRGIVQKRSISDMRAGRPDTDSALKVVLVRLIVNVEYIENAPVNTGDNFEIMPVTISDENGQVFIDITEDITEEEIT